MAVLNVSGMIKAPPTRWAAVLKKGKKSPVLTREVEAESRAEAVTKIRESLEAEGLLWYAITEIKEIKK
jgi:hypothetical protein